MLWWLFFHSDCSLLSVQGLSDPQHIVRKSDTEEQNGDPTICNDGRTQPAIISPSQRPIALVTKLWAINHSIMLMGDINEELDMTNDQGMARVAAAGGLVDIMQMRLGQSSFNTSIQGSKRINYALVSPNMAAACESAGYDALKTRFVKSDHHGFFMDFKTPLLFGNETPALVAPGSSGSILPDLPGLLDGSHPESAEIPAEEEEGDPLVFQDHESDEDKILESSVAAQQIANFLLRLIGPPTMARNTPGGFNFTVVGAKNAVTGGTHVHGKGERANLSAHERTLLYEQLVAKKV